VGAGWRKREAGAKGGGWVLDDAISEKTFNAEDPEDAEKERGFKSQEREGSEGQVEIEI